jgi:hypothetical protein
MSTPVATLRRMPFGPRHWSKKHILVLLLLVGTAMAGFMLEAVRSSRRIEHSAAHGPVTAGGGRTMTSMKVEVGQTFTFGGIVLFNSARQEAMLEGISVDPAIGPELTTVEIKAAGKDRKTGYVGTDSQFPPSLLPAQSLRPFVGTVVPGRRDDPEDAGVEVVFGLKVTQPGKYGFRHVVVDYRVGGKRHRVRLDDGFVACAPVRDFPSGCSLDQPG